MQGNRIVGQDQNCLYNVQADPGLHIALCWSWSTVFLQNQLLHIKGKLGITIMSLFLAKLSNE